MADPEDPVDYGMLNRRIGYVLRRAQIAVFQDFYETVGALDISPAQYSVLSIIEANPGLSQTQVADALGIKKANFVAMIKGLGSRGLAERRPTPNDRRSYALHLTDRGHSLIRELHAASDRHEQRIRSAVGEQAYRDLVAPLVRISKIARSKRT